MKGHAYVGVNHTTRTKSFAMIDLIEPAQNSPSRRKVLTGGFGMAAAMTLSTAAAAESILTNPPTALSIHNRSQMLFLVQNGFRVVAHDRRGHGRSSQTSSGNDMNGYADDLAAVIEALDLKDATLVGHSTGGGEVARYIGRHGTSRVAKAVLVAAVPPIMLKSAANPEGLPLEVFDGLRAGVTKDRSQFYKDLAI